VIADSKPIATFVSLQLLDISLEEILEHLQTVADVAADFLGKARNCSRAASGMMRW
jgi:hypothetical protein